MTGRMLPNSLEALGKTRMWCMRPKRQLCIHIYIYIWTYVQQDLLSSKCMCNHRQQPRPNQFKLYCCTLTNSRTESNRHLSDWHGQYYIIIISNKIRGDKLKVISFRRDMCLRTDAGADSCIEMVIFASSYMNFD